MRLAVLLTLSLALACAHVPKEPPRPAVEYAFNEIPLPHGNNRMLVREEETTVQDLQVSGTDLMDRVSPQIIREPGRDLFGPYAAYEDPKNRNVHFVFLRYHRRGEDKEGP